MIKLSNGKSIATNQFDLMRPCTDKIPDSFKSVKDYNKYLLCSLPHVYRDHLFFYQIPKSLKVYSNSESHPNQLYFNTIDTNLDVVYEYHFKHSIDLVDLNNKSNVNILIATAIQNNRNDIVDAFEYGNYEEILKFLCTLNIYGMISVNPVTIHLCNPKYYISLKNTPQ